jgi:hypothetical protein
MARICINLEIDERKALFALAQRERRDPREQAALLVRQGLTAVGVLPPGPAATQSTTLLEGLPDWLRNRQPPPPDSAQTPSTTLPEDLPDWLKGEPDE